MVDITKAISKYKPLSDQLNAIKNGSMSWSKSYYGFIPKWTTPPNSECIKSLGVNITRKTQLESLLKSCLNRDNIMVSLVNTKIEIYFVHKGKLRRTSMRCRGLYCINWGRLTELLSKMEEVYNGP